MRLFLGCAATLLSLVGTRWQLSFKCPGRPRRTCMGNPGLSMNQRLGAAGLRDPAPSNRGWKRHGRANPAPSTTDWKRLATKTRPPAPEAGSGGPRAQQPAWRGAQTCSKLAARYNYDTTTIQLRYNSRYNPRYNPKVRRSRTFPKRKKIHMFLLIATPNCQYSFVKIQILGLYRGLYRELYRSCIVVVS